MLIKSLLLLLLLKTVTLYAAEPSDNLGLYLDAALLATLITPDSKGSEEPLSVDPNFPWDAIFFEGHYPCLESDGCKDSFKTLEGLTSHLKTKHSPCYNPPLRCPALDKGIQQQFPHVQSMPIVYRTMWALHFLAHQRTQNSVLERTNATGPSRAQALPREQQETVASPAAPTQLRKRKAKDRESTKPKRQRIEPKSKSLLQINAPKQP